MSFLDAERQEEAASDARSRERFRPQPTPVDSTDYRAQDEFGQPVAPGLRHSIETNQTCNTVAEAARLRRLLMEGLGLVGGPPHRGGAVTIAGIGGLRPNGKPRPLQVQVSGNGAVLRDVVTCLDRGGFLD